ncbi:alpha-ketoglutarate-dependent dioxygenase AlkB [Flavobacterium sp.]|uniref:alpha-ketoglutarate-dependent dioxygenase AlkB family protein n=1 Tax=Flavobacterium sp. TaxID=239 RepID=UPI0011F5F045|nr:alpha-ketoglutarate-dependent dioxygenase AlkB [Flavobacterium sp.]RZJ71764.1 MAG: alpha-ketoglutarate-dependent dioxygenase AlkB [Flavobacterium sp.]
MMLFNDTDLFTAGTRGKINFDLPDAEVRLVDGFIPKDFADEIYAELLNNTPWREYQMEIYDKTVTAPRMIAWYEDKHNPGADQDGLDWTPTLLQIKARVEQETSLNFNSVLLNLYRDGRDGVSWHSDREHTIGQNPTIASVTFGETRLFRLRHKSKKDQKQIEIPLHHGSFLLMVGTTNTFWQHEVPKTARQVLPRINLTFRIARRA